MSKGLRVSALALVAIAASIEPAAAAEVGDRGKAPWSGDGRYYPVEIAAKRGSRCKMHWLIPWQKGAYDEWGRCASFVPDYELEVLWNGAWYPASVVGYGPHCYVVHYTGYSDSSNECVTQDRVRW